MKKILGYKKIGKNESDEQTEPSGLFMKLSDKAGLFSLEKCLKPLW